MEHIKKFQMPRLVEGQALKVVVVGATIFFFYHHKICRSLTSPNHNFLSSPFYSALIPKRKRESKRKEKCALVWSSAHKSKDKALLEKWPTPPPPPPSGSLLQHTCSVSRASCQGTMSLPVSSALGQIWGRPIQLCNTFSSRIKCTRKWGGNLRPPDGVHVLK